MISRSNSVRSDGWGLKDRLLAHRRAGGDIESFIRREQAADILPPGRLASATLEAAEELIEKLVGALDARGARAPTTEPHEIDVVLATGTRIVGRVPVASGPHPGPIEVTVAKKAETQLLGPWIDLLALTADDPTTAWSSVVLSRPKSKTKTGFAEEVVEIPLDDPDARRQRAETALALVVDLYRRGCREPLPLFPRLSPELHKGKPQRRPGPVTSAAPTMMTRDSAGVRPRRP